MSQKSILAKLLATENITVQHGNYETAWFDIKNRILGLPQWVDNGKDVSDLLIGHEVGHALETPFEGWHDSPEKLEGCPRTYINVVEDARIERKIKSRYVGLVGPFQRGYKKLFEDEFFGTNHDFDNMKLIDKINLKAKVGAHLNIPFNSEEQVLYNATMTTDTFDEVIQVVKDILDYTKENTPELLSPPPMEQEESDIPNDDGENMPGPNSSGHDDYEQPEQEQSKQESADGEDSDDRKETNKSSSQSDDEETPSAEDSNYNQPQDADVSETDEAFRQNERKLLDLNEFGDQDVVMRGMSKANMRKAVCTYKKLKAERARGFKAYEEWAELSNKDAEEYGHDRRQKSLDEYQEGFKEYIANAKRSVNFAVKEFEMRKAAFRWTRAETARSGSINVNKLWSYKTDDDIFAKVTRLADAKNHGLIGLIDYSGSMSGCMGHVLDQVVHLGLFCKAVNIPFDIYGFTCTDREHHMMHSEDGEMHHSNLSMPQILSSTLKKVEFNEALYHCYLRREMNSGMWWNDDRQIVGKSERYGSTPLNEALSCTTHLVDEFKKKHGVDKMNLVLISDGDANRSHPAEHYGNDLIKRTRTKYYGQTILHQNGKQIKVQGTGRALTREILSHLQNHYHTNNIGFFITESSHDWRCCIGRVFSEMEEGNDEWSDEYKDYYKDANKEYRKNKCFITKSVKGYDEYYVIKGGHALKTEEESFEPEADASKGQITQAFKKHSKSKKNNKVLLTNFGRAVA